MSARQPSRIALAIFDCFISNNDPLRGDLQLGVLAAAMLVLLAFEAVFVTNATYRFLFSAPQDIRGSMYHFLLVGLFHPLPATAVPPEPLEIWRAVAATLTALPIGWFIARVREHHRTAAVAAFSASITLCAALNLHIPLSTQYVTATAFILGVLLAGTIEATIDTHSSQDPQSF